MNGQICGRGCFEQCSDVDDSFLSQNFTLKTIISVVPKKQIQNPKLLKLKIANSSFLLVGTPIFCFPFSLKLKFKSDKHKLHIKPC